MNRPAVRQGPITLQPRPNYISQEIQQTDPRLQRCRIASIPVENIVMLMTMNGDYGVRMTGWPEGAEVIGVKLITKPSPRLDLLLYHPDFPLNLTNELEQVMVTATRVE